MGFLSDLFGGKKEQRHKEELMRMANYISGRYDFAKEYNFQDYGFEIKSMYSDINNSTIDFNGVRVLDKYTYIEGTWEAVLKWLYDKCREYVISKNRSQIDSYNSSVSQKELFKKVIELVKTSGQNIVSLPNDIIVKKETKSHNGEIDQESASFFDGYYYSVYEGSEKVFSVRAYRLDDEHYWYFNSYTPGSWENVLLSETKNIRNQKLYESDSVAEQYLKRLRLH